MFEKIKTVEALKSALREGLVSLEVQGVDATKNVMVVTANADLVGVFTKSRQYSEIYRSAIQQTSEPDVIVVFDVIRRQAIEFVPSQYAGVALKLGTVDGFKEPFRSVGLQLSMNQTVVVKGLDASFTGKVVAINNAELEHYYVVLLGVEQGFKTLSFTPLGITVDGVYELVDEGANKGHVWLDSNGVEFFPAANLNRDGYSVPCPLIFVVYDNADVGSTIALDECGRDASGNQVMHKVAVDHRPIETERYLVANQQDLLLVSKKGLSVLKGKIDFSLPVLAYYKGGEILHITLPRLS
jgi:hypothetical protein